jgi:FemAB-related protein (PEP-CTERM system-associated)
MEQLKAVPHDPASCVLRTFDPQAPADCGRWDAYVRRAAGATPSHRMGWLRVFAKAFGHEPHALGLEDRDGALRGILPLVSLKSRLFGAFLVSMPFLNYGGVVADGPGERDRLLDAAGHLRERLGAAHVELRQVGEALPGLPARSHKVSMHLALAEDEEILWKGLDAKVRNQVRKAGKSGLVAKLGGAELLRDFHAVFAHNMRDLGTPVYARSFFARVLEEFEETSRIVAVYRDGSPVAGGIAVWNGDSLEVPWASSLREYNSLCPNNLLYWEAIRLAVSLGLRTLDFGRSTPGGGTYRFKAQWGARPLPLHWQYLLAPDGAMPDLTPSNPRYRMAIALWKRLPVPVTKVIGPLLVRNIP